MPLKFPSFREQHLYDKLLQMHTRYMAERLKTMHEFESRGLSPETVNRISRQALVDASTPENRDRIAQLIHELEHLEAFEALAAKS